jgi:cytochrome c oxidase cbb3-type subunit 3
MTDPDKLIEGHNYDGIQELDNSLPRWWLLLFFVTIFFGVWYFFNYSAGSGPSIQTEYRKEKDQHETAELVRSNNQKPLTEAELRVLCKSHERVKKGQEIFKSKCISCHGALGEGGIGPNLTDNYWIHGGKLTEILKTIREGVSDKGMPPWGGMLSQDEIHSVVTYVRSLVGTHPPNAKAPQGDLVIQEAL